MHLMVFPHGVDKECFHHFLFVYLQGEDGVHQIRIVQHHLGWLFGELLIVWINHVDESCVCEILDVVHHRGTAGLYPFSQLTDVGRLGSPYSQLVEESLYLSEVLQFYLFDETGLAYEGNYDLCGESCFFESGKYVSSSNADVLNAGKLGDDIAYVIYKDGRMVLDGTGRTYDFRRMSSNSYGWKLLPVCRLMNSRKEKPRRL